MQHLEWWLEVNYVVEVCIWTTPHISSSQWTLCTGIAWTCNMLIPKKVENGKLRSFYNNIPFIYECFMTNKTPSGTKKHCKSTEPESYQMDKCFCFFFRQASSKL